MIASLKVRFFCRSYHQIKSCTFLWNAVILLVTLLLAGVGFVGRNLVHYLVCNNLCSKVSVNSKFVCLLYIVSSVVVVIKHSYQFCFSSQDCKLALLIVKKHSDLMTQSVSVATGHE